MPTAVSYKSLDFLLRTPHSTLDFAKIEHEHKRCLQFLISLMQSVAGRGSLAHRKIVCFFWDDTYAPL